MKINRYVVSALLLAVAAFVLSLVGPANIEIWCLLNIADKLYSHSESYMQVLYRSKTNYQNSIDKAILINEKILSIDSTRFEQLYDLGFLYMQRALKEEFVDNDKDRAVKWHEKSMVALHKYVICARPYFDELRKAADLYNSFDYPETALVIYRDIGHLIKTDSILALDMHGRTSKRIHEYMNQVVDRETTMIRIELRQQEH